jgi:hypothetical protein
VKLVPAILGSFFAGQEEVLTTLCRQWMIRLRGHVQYDTRTFLPTYDLASKRLLILETSLQSNPNAYRGRENVGAELLFFENEKGDKLHPMTNEVSSGQFSSIVVEMLSTNWGYFDLAQFELYLVHELLHVINPSANFVLGNQAVIVTEDQLAMYRHTFRIIQAYGSLALRTDNVSLIR